MRARTTSQRLAHLGLIWVLVLGGTRAVLVPAEHCGDPTPAAVEYARTAGIEWLVANHRPDGSWLYRYDRAGAGDLGGYNITRHAGTLMSLYQQADPDLVESADRAVAWALDHLVPAGGGLSLTDSVDAPVGASALLAAGLVLRRDLTGSNDHDDLLVELGAFLVSSVEPHGAVAGRWNTRLDRPVPDSASPFFTGEVLWALALLARTFPDDGFLEPAQRIMAYVATDRDRAEGWFPPISDHWAAYGLAELVRAGHELTPEELAYAERLAGIFGMQVRYESQRTNSTFSWITRGRQTLGAGLGTLGEGLGNLVWLADQEPALSHLEPELSERAWCVAGMLVDRQAVSGDPAEHGAWFQFDITQVDDQQHAVSALWLTPPTPSEEASSP